MSKIKSATFTRYAKVYTVLKNDPLLSKQLSKKMVAVCRPDNSTQDFPQEVVHVVDQIQKKNLDVSSCNQKDLMKHAYDILVLHPVPIPSYASKPEPEAEPPPPKPVRKPSAPKVVKVATPKPARKPRTPKVTKAEASEPESEPEPEPEPAAPAKRKRVPKPKVEAAAVLPTAPSETRGEAKAAKPLIYVRPNVPFVVGCAALANLQAVLTLLEPFVNTGDTEAKAVCVKLNDLIDEIHRRTIIPSAKEITESVAG